MLRFCLALNPAEAPTLGEKFGKMVVDPKLGFICVVKGRVTVRVAVSFPSKAVKYYGPRNLRIAAEFLGVIQGIVSGTELLEPHSKPAPSDRRFA